MVRTKMEHKEYILLCLEDTNDWSNATTRRLVMQARLLAPKGSDASHSTKDGLGCYVPVCMDSVYPHKVPNFGPQRGHAAADRSLARLRRMSIP